MPRLSGHTAIRISFTDILRHRWSSRIHTWVLWIVENRWLFSFGFQNGHIIIVLDLMTFFIIRVNLNHLVVTALHLAAFTRALTWVLIYLFRVHVEAIWSLWAHMNLLLWSLHLRYHSSWGWKPLVFEIFLTEWLTRLRLTLTLRVFFLQHG